MLRAIRPLIALGSIALGLVGAVAFASDDPISPKNLALVSHGRGAGYSHEGELWNDLPENCQWPLPLVRPTYVHGPASIRVVAGTYVEIPANAIVLVSWEPAIRGWKFFARCNSFCAQFSNTRTQVAQGRAITLTLPGDLFTGPTGYGAGTVGLEGTPEVSVFEIGAFEARR